MARHSARQGQYLQALGVDRWVRRSPPPGPAADNSVEWAKLAAEVSGCLRCGLHTTRTQTVFGVGNRQAELVVIGEAPGAEEDRQGEPFVGRGGQLLNSMLR